MPCSKYEYCRYRSCPFDKPQLIIPVLDNIIYQFAHRCKIGSLICDDDSDEDSDDDLDLDDLIQIVFRLKKKINNIALCYNPAINGICEQHARMHKL